MNHIDFLPEQVRAQRCRRKRLARQGCLLVAAVAAMALLAYVRQAGVAKAQAQLALLRDSAANVERQLAVRDTLETQVAELLIKKRIDDQLGSRVNVLDAMAELGRLLPPSMSLITLSMETVEVRQSVPSTARTPLKAAGVKLAEPSVKRVRLVLTGLAPSDVDVANFIGQLATSPLFEDVNMGYSRNAEYRGVKAREFQASCYAVN